MADADALFRAGDLMGARAALTDALKSNPADQPARLFLVQLLCLLGDWDKAAIQLRSLASITPEAAMLASTYGMAIEAERVRDKVFSGLAPPALLVSEHPWAGGLAAALALDSSGDAEAGAKRREQAFNAAPDTPGELNGQRFDWIADGDARFGPALEAIVNGRWGLVPFDVIESVKSEGPRDLRDLVWLPVQMRFLSGGSANALLPVRYPLLQADAPAELLMSRATHWREDATGMGQHVWSLSTDEEIDLLALRDLSFDTRS